jgi:hypothetical protein
MGAAGVPDATAAPNKYRCLRKLDNCRSALHVPNWSKVIHKVVGGRKSGADTEHFNA